MKQAQALTFALWRLRHPEFGTAELALSITQEPSGDARATLTVDGEAVLDRHTGKGVLRGTAGQIKQWSLAQGQHLRTVLLQQGWQDCEED